MYATPITGLEKGRNNRLFYLALPPSVFKPVTTMIKEWGFVLPPIDFVINLFNYLFIGFINEKIKFLILSAEVQNYIFYNIVKYFSFLYFWDLVDNTTFETLFLTWP